MPTKLSGDACSTLSQGGNVSLRHTGLLQCPVKTVTFDKVCYGNGNINSAYSKAHLKGPDEELATQEALPRYLPESKIQRDASNTLLKSFFPEGAQSKTCLHLRGSWPASSPEV